MTTLSLYDLPCVLFNFYVKELSLEVHEITLWHTERVLISCKYILLPSMNGPTVLLLADNRSESTPEDRQQVELIIFPNTKYVEESGIVLDNAERVGSVLVKCSRFMNRSISKPGFQFWLNAKALLKNEIMFSLKLTPPARTKLFEVIERAQELCVNREYRWINSYFKANDSNEAVPCEINCSSI